jgi:uncharacterized protein (TIGR03435 family)
MKLTFAICTLSLMALGQSAETPHFLAADVRPSPKSQSPTSQFMRPPASRGERYEVKNASIVDLIALAYGYNAVNILGGPSWLELDRFDILAKQPPQTPPDLQKPMLQALLAERFKLVIKEETKAMPSYVLTAGKKPQLKEADGSGDTGCKPQSASGPVGEGIGRIMLATTDGQPIQINLANGMITYQCRNMTMKTFADALPRFLGANLGVNPVLDQTGLSGVWNFEFKYSLLTNGAQRLTVPEAVDKELGLKLEDKPTPVPVIVVQSVNQKPIDNPPGTAEAFPAVRAPTEFEVATIKPANPDSKSQRFQMQPGGRLIAEGMPLQFMIGRAFNATNPDQIAGIPAWANTARFDLVAKAPADGTAQTQLDPDVLAPMMLSFLKDRFKMTYHTEQRDMPVYVLTAGKPKMTKADPSTRTWCKSPQQIPGAAPAPQGSTAIICQNVTMGQFIDLLRLRPELLLRSASAVDSTELEGSWDFRITYNQTLTLQAVGLIQAPLRAAPGGAPDNPAGAASDPVSGYSLFEAIEKQLGLKLTQQKKPATVYVIDHIEQTPTEN